VAATSAAEAHLLGFGAALITFGLMCWQLSGPALWMDESASVVATQRTWPNLWLLLQGSDAPLVPYYVVLKALTGLGVHVDSGLWLHPEVMYRWPSVVAVAVAVWVLITWLARTQSPQLAFGTAFALLATSSFSRYGQEARPYALVLMLAVLSTAIWARLVSERSWRPVAWLWICGYAVSIALMTLLHTLAASLLAAHLVAALVAPARGRRRPTFVKTALGGALGVLAVLKVVLIGTANGAGATAWPALTWPHLWLAWLSLFTTDRHPWLWAGPVVALAGLGLTRLRSPRYGFIARLALCWAAVPPLVLLPLLFRRHNLLLGRYLLFTLPGWAILAGLGVATIAEVTRRLVTRGLRRLPGRGTARGAVRGEWSVALRLPGVGSIMHTGLTGRKGAVLDRILDAVAHALRPRTLRLRVRLAWTAWLVAGAVTAGVLAATAHAQDPGLTAVRAPGGHTANIRPVLDAANWPEYRGLPVVVTSSGQAISVPAYDRALDARLVGLTVQRTGATIWMHFDGNLRRRVLDVSPRVVVLLQDQGATWSDPGCVPGSTVVPAGAFTPVSLLVPDARVERCLPPTMQRMGYRVVRLVPGGAHWNFAVVDRTPPFESPQALAAQELAEQQVADSREVVHPRTGPAAAS
jgi:hypothetical protein